MKIQTTCHTCGERVELVPQHAEPPGCVAALPPVESTLTLNVTVDPAAVIFEHAPATDLSALPWRDAVPDAPGYWWFCHRDDAPAGFPRHPWVSYIDDLTQCQELVVRCAPVVLP